MKKDLYIFKLTFITIASICSSCSQKSGKANVKILDDLPFSNEYKFLSSGNQYFYNDKDLEYSVDDMVSQSLMSEPYNIKSIIHQNYLFTKNNKTIWFHNTQINDESESNYLISSYDFEAKKFSILLNISHNQLCEKMGFTEKKDGFSFRFTKGYYDLNNIDILIETTFTDKYYNSVDFDSYELIINIENFEELYFGIEKETDNDENSYCFANTGCKIIHDSGFDTYIELPSGDKVYANREFLLNNSDYYDYIDQRLYDVQFINIYCCDRNIYFVVSGYAHNTSLLAASKIDLPLCVFSFDLNTMKANYIGHSFTGISFAWVLKY